MRRSQIVVALACVFTAAGCSERFDCVVVGASHPAQEQALKRLWFDDTGARLFALEGATIRVWDAANGTLEKRLGPGFAGQGAAAGSVWVASDLSRMGVFTGLSRGGTLAYHADIDDAAPSWTTRIDRGVSVVGLGPGQSIVVQAPARFPTTGAPDDGPRVQVWRDGESEPAFERETVRHGSSVVSASGRYLAFTPNERQVVVVDLTDPDARERTIAVKEPRGAIFSADETRLALLEKYNLRIVDPTTGAVVSTTSIGTLQLKLRSFDDDLTVSTFLDDAIHRYDAAGSSLWRFAIRGPDGKGLRIWQFDVARHNDTIVASLHNDLRVFAGSGIGRARMLCKEPCYGPNTNLVNAIAVTPSGDRAAVAANRSLVIWRTDGSGTPLKLHDPALK